MSTGTASPIPKADGSRVGRTITAPAVDDPRPVRFAFVSCQNANQGAQNAYRRMIFEDERAPEAERIGFVLHLGDFIYEIVWYPEDRPQGMYDRRMRDIVRYPHGEKIRDFHIPTTVEDYRAVYRAYLSDPDLQDARARWPFVNMWDNHEFSWLGWQSLQKFEGRTRPAQTRKVAANQAFFEYQPARITKPSGPSLDRFDPPQVVDTPVTRFDEHGLGQEPNNLAAIGSLKGYRALAMGPKRGADRNRPAHAIAPRSLPTGPRQDLFRARIFPNSSRKRPWKSWMRGAPIAVVDPPTSIRFGSRRDRQLPERPARADNSRRRAEGLVPRALAQLQGDLEDLGQHHRHARHACRSAKPPARQQRSRGRAPVTPLRPLGDHGTAYVERGEIYDFVQATRITGFVTVAGDRHSFWAGLAAKSLPPKPFRPVGIAFVTGSISAPGLVEALEHALPKDHPLRSLYVGQGPGDHATAANREHAASARSARHVSSTRRAATLRKREPVQSRLVTTPFVCRHGRPRLLGCPRDQRIHRD